MNIIQTLKVDEKVALDALIKYLQEEKDYTPKKISAIIANNTTVFLPLSIFETNLCCLEAISVYTKDFIGMNFSDTARLIHRDPKTIWGAYKRAKQKGWHIGKTSGKERIELSVFSDREFSTLESLVFHLKERKKFRLTEIARLTSRDNRTIWTTYKNATKKIQNRGIKSA